jgi:nitrogen-specific signal transduction histidine kinase
MELIALLSNSDELIIPNVKGALKKYTVYPLRTLEELEDLYSNIPLNLFLIDITTHRLSYVGEFLRRLDDNMVVIIAQEKLDKYKMDDLPPSVFDCIDTESIRIELPVIIERALERQRLKNEVRLMKQSRDMIAPVQMSVANRLETEPLLSRNDPLLGGQIPGGRYIQEKVIVNFARMLSVSFDMRKLLDHFIDSVMEIARVSRMSVMLRDKQDFRVKTQYGLDPYIADNLKLGINSALVTWLSKTGRIMSKPVHYIDSDTISINNEMEALQCSVSFPMIYKGKLIGICNIDNKITEESFFREELEIIYVLCNYLAAAVKDIDLYHQMWYQKEFTKNILSSMSSGMIAISQEENITVFNQQASEILNLDSSEMVGKDLRVLPSPLGDILYETMVTGTSYNRYEVTVNPGELPLGINSYRLLDEHQSPVGAGIVFSDISDSKKLEQQQRKTEKLEAVNDLMGKIAHEVRNPLTSIQTYIQLVNEKQDDNDLNNFYVSTVNQSIRRLDSLIDKLVTFSSTQDYNFKKEEIDDIISGAGEFISKVMPQSHQLSIQSTDKVFYINADKKQIIKAIYYVILCIIDRKPEETFIEMNARTVLHDVPFVEISIAYQGDEFAQEGEQNLLKPLSDIDHLGTELNLPISRKIIEGHKGSLDLKREGEMNTFVIRLPILDRRGSRVSAEGGRVSGE